ncbi:MAG: DUF6377 domain-containing protein [Rikenellaceae bacterium]
MILKYLIYVSIFLSSITSFAQSSNADVLKKLDEVIENKYIYKVEKDKHIETVKISLENEKKVKLKYNLSQEIFEEYKSYQYDSAYVYALKSYEFAKESGDVNLIAKSQCNLLFCYLTVGLFKEGAEVINDFFCNNLLNEDLQLVGEIDEAIDKTALANFYSKTANYYKNLMLYVGNTTLLSEKYKGKALEYMQLALNNLDENSLDYKLIVAERRLFVREDIDKSIKEIENLIETSNLSLHKKAIVYSWLATTYEEKNDFEKAINCVAISAIYDIESSTYETTAAKVLARYMYEKGDIKRANKYIKMALDDAITYNTPFRKLEIQALMPSINEVRYSSIEKDRRFLFAIVVVFVIFIVAIVLMFIKIKKRNESLRSARLEIEARAAELSGINLQLSEVNNELAETNRIKDLYIIKSLFGDSAFVDRVEKMSKAILRKIKAKQYSELEELVGGLGIRKERERMSSSFDSAFLKLFPNFIEEYNKLFPEEYAISLGEDGSLSAEVRIFALVRLGVEDITQVSNYLNLSPNTIYVYKAKVKSRTIVEKSKFESYIKAIK